MSPSDILRLLKQPAGLSRSAVRASDYMDYAIQLLQKRSLQEHRVHKRSINATGRPLFSRPTGRPNQYLHTGRALPDD